MGRPLRIGVQLPEVERVVRWAELAAMARRAEDVGLDSIWVGDHLLYRDEDGTARGPWEMWSLLAGLAVITERLEIGSLVASTSFHNPAVLAKKAATIDEMSGGRLVLGLGAGWNRVEYEAYGFPYDHRVSRFEEAFTIIRTLLADGRIDFTGQYYGARDCELVPRGPRAAGPPLMIGSTGERMLRITLPYVHSWNAWFLEFGNLPEGIAPLRATVDAACEAAGRDPATVERTVAVLVGLRGAQGRPGRDASGRAVSPLTGSPAALADGLRAFAAQGIAHVQLVLDPISERSISELQPVLELLDAD